MDIKDLDKKQLVLLTLLITFVVSIATGIVTVSLMKEMPKSVPQTINNVIQRTIEKVTTIEAPVKEGTSVDTDKDGIAFLGDGDTLVSIYAIDAVLVLPEDTVPPTSPTDTTNPSASLSKELGQGIIISDIGLILVETSILNEKDTYKVVLNKKDFDATILKKFNNGFTVLKISEKKAIVETPVKPEEVKATQ